MTSGITCNAHTPRYACGPIWYLEGNQSLSRPRRQSIVDANNDIFVSIASLWEIVLKIGVGKLKISRSISEIFHQLSDQSISILHIMPGHVLQVAALPFYHRDPFDRMIIAQAQVEFLSVMTRDGIFADYGIKLL